MRICFLADSEAINTRNWVDYFADRLGHDVHVVSVNRSGELSPAVRLHRVGSGEGTSGTFGKLALLRHAGRVRRIVWAISPDIVVGYRVASYGFLGAVTGFHPLVVAAQGQPIVFPRRSLPKMVFARTAIRNADLLNSWAPHMTRRLIELGAEPAKILTCPRGIDLELFPAGGEAVEGASVISTRTLHRMYHVDVIVRAIALVKNEVPGVSGIVVGDGNAATELEEMASALGIRDSVTFEGRVAYGRLPELLRASAIYASAVPTDGVSASLLEAMATGCFPIVRDNEANRLWVEDGRNGFLVRDGDPRSYADAITRALANRDLRSRAAVENRRIVEERGDLSKNMRTFEAAYEELVERVPKAGRRRGGVGSVEDM
jgi:glycosyltransferase involved in cell wall biosynthesis